MRPPSSAKVTAPQKAITAQMTQTMRFQPEVPAYPATMAGPAKMPEPMMEPTITAVAETGPRSRLSSVSSPKESGRASF